MSAPLRGRRDHHGVKIHDWNIETVGEDLIRLGENRPSHENFLRKSQQEFLLSKTALKRELRRLFLKEWGRWCAVQSSNL